MGRSSHGLQSASTRSHPTSLSSMVPGRPPLSYHSDNSSTVLGFLASEPPLAPLEILCPACPLFTWITSTHSPKGHSVQSSLHRETLPGSQIRVLSCHMTPKHPVLPGGIIIIVLFLELLSPRDLNCAPGIQTAQG